MDKNNKKDENEETSKKKEILECKEADDKSIKEVKKSSFYYDKLRAIILDVVITGGRTKATY